MKIDNVNTPIRYVCGSGLLVAALMMTSPFCSAQDSVNVQNQTGPFRFDGMLDLNYPLSLNHPAGHVNQLQNFDDRANQLNLNMAWLSVDYLASGLGFHADAGAGRAYSLMGAGETDASGLRFVRQAYVELKPESWRGLELDFGKFATFASAEVPETANNWNYSRSLLFTWAVPYYHFGVRATGPLTKTLTGGVELVSGWNNIVTGATYKTVGMTASWNASSKVTWANTYYSGQDENVANRGLRNLYDSVLQLTPTSRTNIYVNFDYLHDRPIHSAAAYLYGVAAAARFRLSQKLFLSPRIEWLDDATGMATGCRQQLREATVTATYKIIDRVSFWLEFRDDRSNQDFFNRGSQSGARKDQPTILAGLVATINPTK